MKSVSYLLAAGAALTLSLGTLQSAKANTFKFLDVNNTDVVSISIIEATKTVNESVYTGAYGFSIDDQKLEGFCTAVRNDIQVGDNTSGTAYADITGSSALPSAGYIDNTHKLKEVNAAAVAWVTSKYLNDASKTKRTEAALAIWDIVNDGGDGTANGNFTVTGTDLTTFGSGADAITLAAYNTTDSITNVAWEKTPKDGGDGSKYQDFAYDPIPEPAFYQMGAFLTGGGLLALRLRKRK